MCPICGKTKSTVLDITYNPRYKELYRKRKCEECGEEFYTVEFEVPFNKKMRREWYLYHKKKKRE